MVKGKPSKRARKDEDEDDVSDENEGENVVEDEELDVEEEEPQPKPKKKSKPAKEKPADGEKKGRGKKGKKDPNEPKRASSAFFHFSSAKRAEVKEQNPGIAFGEVGKKLGEMWKALSSTDKKPYEDSAAKDKARYEKEMEAYKAAQEAA